MKAPSVFLRLLRNICRRSPPILAYRLYHTFLINLEGSNFSFQNVRALFGNAKIDVFMTDVSDARFAFHGCDEWSGLTLCGLLATKGDVVFEIGANSGTETLSLAAVVGNAGRVVALEPNVDVSGKLEERITRNRLNHVIIVRKAASDRPGNGILTLGPLSNTGMAYLKTESIEHGNGVEITTIDRLSDQFGLPQIVWMDVEGYELKALRGGAKVLTEARPFIFCEIDRGHLTRAGDSLEEFELFLKDHRYHAVDPNRWHLPTIDVPSIAAGYYHTNWLLVPTEKKANIKSIRGRYLLSRLLPRI